MLFKKMLSILLIALLVMSAVASVSADSTFHPCCPFYSVGYKITDLS
ncbi:MAG: hypothetical protein LBV42_00405 [Methanobrevibacter sp.]|jgi:hypothetical protein|nr:hypothetical protein [Methanobrevibacter sp.]